MKYSDDKCRELIDMWDNAWASGDVRKDTYGRKIIDALTERLESEVQGTAAALSERLGPVGDEEVQAFAQEKFLRELAERVGWERYEHILEDAFEGQVAFYHPDDIRYGWKKRGVDWLVTPNGMMYLVERAREKGWDTRSVSYWKYFPGDAAKTVWVSFDRTHDREAEGLPDILEGAGSEPWATAYAVGRIYGLEPPEKG